MTTVSVSASRTYEVQIGTGLLSHAGEICAPFSPLHAV